MNRSTFVTILVSLSLSLSSLVGCSDSSDPDERTSAPGGGEAKDTKRADDATEPAKDDDEGSSVGPQCEAYLDCCDEIVKDQPSLAGSCDATRKSVEDAIDKGVATDTYESSCKQALATMQSAGYCQ